MSEEERHISEGDMFKSEEETVQPTIIHKHVIPRWVDERLKIPLIFSMIVICQGLFGGLGLKQVPNRIIKLSNNPIARFIFITAIAYTATSDIEQAIFSVVLFFIIMYLIRTPAERAMMPHFI